MNNQQTFLQQIRLQNVSFDFFIILGNLFVRTVHCVIVYMPLSQFPTRVTVTTFNVWGQKYWPQRGETLFQSFQSLQSDIYLLQEVSPQILEFLDRNLTSRYARVQGTGGWLSESNIYWNDSLFSLVDHGRSYLEIEDYPERGLFWVRLSLRTHPTMTVFLCTAHFPWVGCNAELATGINQRCLQIAPFYCFRIIIIIIIIIVVVVVVDVLVTTTTYYIATCLLAVILI